MKPLIFEKNCSQLDKIETQKECHGHCVYIPDM